MKNAVLKIALAIPVLFVLIVIFFSLSSTTRAENKFVKAIWDNGNFGLRDLPDGTRVASAPACLSKDFLSRYPGYVEKMAEQTACANVELKASILGQKIASAESSLDVINFKRRILMRTAQFLRPIIKLDQLGGGLIMPIGALQEVGFEGSNLKSQCELADNKPITGAEPIGIKDIKFDKAIEFSHSSAGIDDSVLNALPKIIDQFIEGKELLASLALSKHMNNFMAVTNDSIMSELSEIQKGVVAREGFHAIGVGETATAVVVAPANAAKCEKPGYNAYNLQITTRSASKSITGCVEDSSTLEMIKEKTQEKIEWLNKQRIDFQRKKTALATQLETLKQKNAKCF